MLNAKPFQLTTSEKVRLIDAATLSVKAHNAPWAIFFDTSGSVRTEQWRGQDYGGGPVIVVLPKWAEPVEVK